MRRRIEEAWKSFSSTIPPQAGEHQRRDMQVSFFAGAYELFRIVTTGVSAGDEVNPEDLRMMDEIDAELREFRASVIRLPGVN